ncbi:MAG: hypothetical protein ABI559_05725 [Chloroflexota bacterium]
MTDTQTEPERDIHAEADEILTRLRSDLSSGDTHWFLPLLDAVRKWPLPMETVGKREYRYLIAGEAFDWLLLAERLLDDVRELVPSDEAEALLFDQRLPLDITDADLETLLGAKYKPHLNFIYGVRIEEALNTAVAEEVRKERTASHIWDKAGHVDDEVFHRIYGRTVAEMLAEFREEVDLIDPEWVSLADLSEWRYWLFQQRVKMCDPAKVASDTRKGLAFLQRLEMKHRLRTAVVEEVPVDITL